MANGITENKKQVHGMNPMGIRRFQPPKKVFPAPDPSYSSQSYKRLLLVRSFFLVEQEIDLRM